MSVLDTRAKVFLFLRGYGKHPLLQIQFCKSGNAFVFAWTKQQHGKDYGGLAKL